jgi:hypothetical protein
MGLTKKSMSSRPSSNSSSTTTTTMPNPSSSPRFPSISLRSKQSPPTLSTDPLTAHDALLRVARRSNEHSPSPSILGNVRQEAGGVVLNTASPGDKSYDPLHRPVTAYPTQTLGVPSFRHEEFGWCSNQDYRHTSQASLPSLHPPRSDSNPNNMAAFRCCLLSRSTRIRLLFRMTWKSLPTMSSSRPTSRQSASFLSVPSLGPLARHRL